MKKLVLGNNLIGSNKGLINMNIMKGFLTNLNKNNLINNLSNNLNKVQNVKTNLINISKNQ